MRRFRLDRDGHCVAQGCTFAGAAVLHWLGAVGSTAVYPSLDALKAIHVAGHPTTAIRWEDKCCFACGATAERNHGPGFCCYCGATWSDGPVDEKDPSLGRWVQAMVIGEQPSSSLGDDDVEAAKQEAP